MIIQDDFRVCFLLLAFFNFGDTVLALAYIAEKHFAFVC